MKITIVLAILAAFSTAPCQSLVEPPYLHSYGIRKATPAKLFMFFGPFAAFSDPQGVATTKMKSRDDPKTDKDDDEVVVYGVNSGRNQLIYNTSMWTLGLYGGKGAGKDQFMSPKGIAVDPDGNVYVADCGNNRIVHLFNPKSKVRWVNAFTGKTPKDQGLSYPSQVGLDKKGLIYVTDTGNRRIVVFMPDGTVCRTMPPSDAIDFDQGPSMLAIADGSEEWSYFPREHVIFCADRNGTRILKISLEGGLEKQAQMPQGHVAGYAAVDYYHNLWVTDRENNCILKFDHDLNLLDIFGSFGFGKNQFVEPRGIAIWKRYGQTFVAEKEGAQYYWVGSDVKAESLRKNSGTTYTLSLALTEYSYVSLYSSAGRKDTQWIFSRMMASAGNSDLGFDDPRHLIGRNRNCVLRIEPTYSSFSYFKLDLPVRVEQK